MSSEGTAEFHIEGLDEIDHFVFEADIGDDPYDREYQLYAVLSDSVDTFDLKRFGLRLRQEDEDELDFRISEVYGSLTMYNEPMNDEVDEEEIFLKKLKDYMPQIICKFFQLVASKGQLAYESRAIPVRINITGLYWDTQVLTKTGFKTYRHENLSLRDSLAKVGFRHVGPMMMESTVNEILASCITGVPATQAARMSRKRSIRKRLPIRETALTAAQVASVRQAQRALARESEMFRRRSAVRRQGRTYVASKKSSPKRRKSRSIDKDLVAQMSRMGLSKATSQKLSIRRPRSK